jgi:hypothetical protein
LSKPSFIFSARAEDSRISSPMATVICSSALATLPVLLVALGNREEQTHILQNPNLAQDPVHLLIILALELVEHRIAVLALAVRRRRPEPRPPGIRDPEMASASASTPAPIASAAAAWLVPAVSVAARLWLPAGACANGPAGAARVAFEEIAARVAAESGCVGVSGFGLVVGGGSEGMRSGQGGLRVGLVSLSMRRFADSPMRWRCRGSWK